MWMGAPAFQFYFPAVARFVCNATGDVADFVAHFAGTLEFRLEYEAQELTPIAGQLVEFCDFLIERWSRFDEGMAAYGDVGVRYMSLRESFARLAKGTVRP